MTVGLIKHGVGEILQEDDMQKEASAPFSESDRIALAQENAQADAPEEELDVP